MPAAGMPPAAATPERTTDGTDESRVVRGNHRRAMRMCLLPALAVGAVIGVVLAAAGVPVYLAAVVFVVVAAALLSALWLRAPGAVLRGVGARPSREADRPRLHNLVDGLCATMGLPQPAVWVVESPVPNAMSIGRDPGSAVLVVTSALDRSLSLVELEGVLAHELVHVKRHDTVLATVAVALWAPCSLVIGVSSAIERVHAVIGRGREFEADQRAAGVVRYPPGIGSALEVMLAGPEPSTPWPPGRGRTAALTRWLWVDPLAGGAHDPPAEGNLDDTRVRAAALSLR